MNGQKKLFDETATYSTGGVYVNFISEGENRIAAAFGSNYERLAKIKSKYDPDNFFRVNQNIVPASDGNIQYLGSEMMTTRL